MFCNNCGKEINEHSSFCANCGAKVNSVPKQPTRQAPASVSEKQQQTSQKNVAYAEPIYENQKSQVIATILSLFLGIFGIHNFYLGKVGKGILQLILTITVFGAVITTIWAFVEFLKIIDSRGTDKQGNKLRPPVFYIKISK
ncbi:MAG: NINE protein [Christensenellales bacterium]